MQLTATLLERLAAAWERGDRLCELADREAWSRSPDSGAQPLLFHVGHLAAFAWNAVCRGVLNRPSLAPAFDDLFEREHGESPRAPSLETVPMRWPAVDAVLAYRDRVREAVLQAYPLVAEHGEDVMARGGRVYCAVLEHELLHHEILLALLAGLDPSLRRTPADLPPLDLSPGVLRRPVVVPAGPARLGARFEAVPFGWDNEFPMQLVELPAFRIDNVPVSNAEFLAFVEDGGYERRELWTAEGWAARELRGARQPRDWRVVDGERRVATAFDEVPLTRAFDWPVRVDAHEAEAFARREGARLPTEAEILRAGYQTRDDETRTWPWGEAAPSPRHGNFDLSARGPVAVGSRPDGASAFGVLELVGNGWEWTASPFAPFRGFTAYMPQLPDWSSEAFDGRHRVLHGGSWATDRDLLRRSLRHRALPDDGRVFAKFRTVRPA